MTRHVQMGLLAAAVVAAATLAAAADAPTAASKPSAKLRAGTDARKPGPRGRRRMTDQQEAELLALIAKRQPEFHKRLLEKRTTSPMAYRWEMQLLWGRYQRIRHLPKDVQDAALDQMESKGKIINLVRQYRKADSDGEKVRLENALREVVAAQFDAEQTLNAHRLGELDKQLKRMRADLAAQAKTRDKIIQSRFERALKRAREPKAFGNPERPAMMSAALTGNDAPARVILVQNGQRDSDRAPDARRSGGRFRRHELTAEQETELLEALKAKSPTHYDRLVALKRDTPREYPRFASAMWRWYQQWKKMPPDVQGPALTVMDRQVMIFRLTREHKRAANDAERDTIAAQLKTAIGEHFDAELKVRAHALGVFEKRIAGMHRALADRAKKRDEIIAQRLKDYLSGNHTPQRKPHLKPRPHKKHPELPEADGG